MKRQAKPMTLMYLYQDEFSWGTGMSIKDAKKNARRFGKGKHPSITIYKVKKPKLINEALNSLSVTQTTKTFENELVKIIADRVEI